MYFIFGVSKQIKPLQPIGQAAEFRFESKFEPLPTSAGYLAITPEGHLRRQSNDFTAKSMAKLLGPRSSKGWAGLTVSDSDGRAQFAAQTQGVSESAAVAAGRDRLA